MSDLIEQLAAKLPGPWDAIVGIPRGAHVTTAALWVLADSSYRPDVWVEEVDTLPSARSLIGGTT